MADTPKISDDVFYNHLLLFMKSIFDNYSELNKKPQLKYSGWIYQTIDLPEENDPYPFAVI